LKEFISVGNLKKLSKYSFQKEDLSRFIEIVKTGSKQEAKKAKKQIDHFWHNFYLKNREEGKDAFKQFLDEIKHFDDICDIDHQAHFINALKWAIWAIGDDYFEIWVEFICKCMQHPSGIIRQQTIHTASILTLSFNLSEMRRPKKAEQPDKIARYKQTINLIKFGLYAYKIEQLIKKYSEPKFKKYKYVGSLPVSIYKSLQKLMVEEILRGEYYNLNYEWFLHFFEGRLQKIYSENYSVDLSLLLNLVDETDCDVIDYIDKNWQDILASSKKPLI